MNFTLCFLKNLFNFKKDLKNKSSDEIIFNIDVKEEVLLTQTKKRKNYKPSLNSKHFKVKQHLIELGSITSWQAIELYGATRLSAIIFNLRKSGMNIESIHSSSLDRNSEICNYTTYKLIKNENN